MKKTSRASIGLAACAVWAIAAAMLWPVSSQAQTGAPRYEVDMSWPMPWPERWVIGPLGAVCVDAQDHVLLLNRQELVDVDLDAGQKAPAVIELDPAGRVVNSWNDEVFTPFLINAFHSCHVDADNNVWILSTESGMVRKYSHDGKKVLLQIGKSDVVDSSDGTLKGKPLNSNAPLFFSPADISVDRRNGDVYVDDGDGAGNHRIAVMDRTGKFLRQWQPQAGRSIHCMAMANDGLVYLCDRRANRLQVYDKMGGLMKNIDIPWKQYTPVASGDSKRQSGAAGSAVDISLSRDANQRLVYVINQNNSQIDILDRQIGKVLSSFGRSGHLPGQFDQPLGIDVDSKGNVYVTENRGKRVQKFKMVGQ
jgi:hypothetical protein